MPIDNKVIITLDNGKRIEAQAPVIISASRSTDIPAFYSDWFFDRLNKGYSVWTNPFNGLKSYISYENTQFIVFWSKNPEPLIEHLPKLKEKGIKCYIQFTLNDYEQLERGVPSLEKRIETFKKLSDLLGKKAVIWRYDPLLLTQDMGVDDLLSKIEKVGDQLMGYTERFIFSFADIAEYIKVKNNLNKSHIQYIEWDNQNMEKIAAGISELNKKWKYQTATCAESIDLEKYGISHAHCIDDELIAQLSYPNKKIFDYLGLETQINLLSLIDLPDTGNEIIINDTVKAVRKKNNKDKGQRTACGCVVSKDIGEYNTCPHLCEYCYANASKELAQKNYKIHKESPFAETITGD